MILGKPADPNYLSNIQKWHTVFAWRPTTLVDGRVAWLENIERRYIYDEGNWAGDNSRWEHRAALSKDQL